jgi:hypothetical protein
MNKVLVRIEDYKRYTEKYNTTRLDRKNEIYTNGGLPKFLNIKEEIFEGRVTPYSIIEDNNRRVLIKFNSKSNIEYRIDLIKEPIDDIWHIGFSLFNSELDNSYHDRTNNDESIDVFARVIWILKDLNKNIEYCIGATGTPKDKIYEFMMRYISNWEKRDTNEYDLGWGLYFHL